MIRLGSLILTAVLLGLPRLFPGSAASLRRRSPHVEPAPCDPALLDFIAELRPLIDSHCRALADPDPGNPVVVEIHRLVPRTGKDGTRVAEAISVSVQADGRFQPMIFECRPGRRSPAARALVAMLMPATRLARFPRADGGPVWA